MHELAFFIRQLLLARDKGLQDWGYLVFVENISYFSEIELLDLKSKYEVEMSYKEGPYYFHHDKVIGLIEEYLGDKLF